MKNNNIIFVSSYLSRQMIKLAKKMSGEGYAVQIAAPENENMKYAPPLRMIKLRKFWKFLFGLKKVAKIKGKIVALDALADNALAQRKIKHLFFDSPLGIDLSTWNPAKASGNKQTNLLAEYGVHPHHKMLLVLSPDERDIRRLILAIQGSERNDFVLGIYGTYSPSASIRISRRIRQEPRIVYLGTEQDLPNLLRASFAVISLSDEPSFYKLSALAMGRPAAWNGSGIKSNMEITGDLAETIHNLLDLTEHQRGKYELANLKAVQFFDINQNISELKSLLS